MDADKRRGGELEKAGGGVMKECLSVKKKGTGREKRDEAGGGGLVEGEMKEGCVWINKRW